MQMKKMPIAIVTSISEKPSRLAKRTFLMLQNFILCLDVSQAGHRVQLHKPQYRVAVLVPHPDRELVRRAVEIEFDLNLVLVHRFVEVHGNKMHGHLVVNPAAEPGARAWLGCWPGRFIKKIGPVRVDSLGL